MLPSDQPFATLVGEGQTDTHDSQAAWQTKGAPWGALFWHAQPRTMRQGWLTTSRTRMRRPGSCRSITSSIGPFVS